MTTTFSQGYVKYFRPVVYYEFSLIIREIVYEISGQTVYSLNLTLIHAGARVKCNFLKRKSREKKNRC